ncbi:unnamed protein product [Adineta steineri]|uniref:Reverse transcriptase domain-containing protein n=1 Tax=Adineta steineri TaxID=433720 RepID=A0A815JRT5_9BILA|nr:unnamed protein product [Adineta steineri]CAF3811997.1 unnamed protein product [Adineta steineri]
MIVNEKKKLTDSTTGQIPLSKSLVSVLNAIAAPKIVFFRRRSDGYRRKGRDGWNRRSDILNTFNHILPSSPIIEVDSSLSSRQLAFLANGPKYVPTCQSRFSHSKIDVILKQEHENIMKSFKTTLTDNCLSISDQRAKEFFASIENLLCQLQTKSVSHRLSTRIRYDDKMVKSIQRIQKRENIVLRRTDKSKVFHLGSTDSYHRKSMEYMQKTNAYKEITSGINPCMDHLHQVLTFINPLLQKKLIDLKLWKQWMRPNIETIELAHLYFIPKPHKIGTPLRPIVSSIRAAAKGLSHFLDQLLRPIFNRAARQTTFINGIHFIRRLELYRNIGRLSSTTTFITFDVTDLYTMIPRDGALHILEEFLYKHARNGRIHGMTIDTIMKMAHLVLNTNCFVFENKYYEQIRGGAMGSPFTMTLANIYMLKWEQSLTEHQKFHNELYGRYIDDVFMTTNLSVDQINLLLDRANGKDENIHISRSIGSTIEFLDVLVNNNHGQLHTSVYHKPAAEPYIVPFLSDHPRYIHRNTIKGALFRAVRLCSNVEDFDKERLNIELMLLLNGYPPKFVSYHFKQFFEQHHVMSLMNELNDDIYRELHHRLIIQPTYRERERERQVCNKKEIRVLFAFESGPKLQLKRELYRLWKKYYIYEGSLVNDVKLKFSSKSNKSLNELLIRKKPPRSMLITNHTTTST